MSTVRKLGKWWRSIDWTNIINWIKDLEFPQIFLGCAILFLFWVIFFVESNSQKDNYIRIITGEEVNTYKNYRGLTEAAGKRFVKMVDKCLTKKHPGFYMTGENGNDMLFGCDTFRNGIIEFNPKLEYLSERDKEKDKEKK
jgi:hypothetical protein